MKDLGLLTLRLTTGGLLAGHGAQKLFGSFEGHGLQGTAGWLESMGMRPGHRWAMLAGASEFAGGLLTAFGLGGGLGPVATMGAMGMATGTAHWGKPIWVTSGGAELPVTNMAVASALAMSGPGRYSLDRLFGIRVPGWLTFLGFLVTAGGVFYGMSMHRSAQEDQQAEQPETEEQDQQAPGTEQRPAAGAAEVERVAA